MDRLLCVCLISTLTTTVGCSGARLTPAFESVDPQERTAALLEATRDADAAAVPELILMLYSGDPAERMLAGNALRSLTGHDFGYHHYDSPWKREQAADKWRVWWERQSADAPNPNEPSVLQGGGAAADAP